MSGGELWNDYGACELEYHNDTLLLACQQHRMVAYFNSKTDTQKVAPHILSIHISLCPTSFRPLPSGLKYYYCPASSHHYDHTYPPIAKHGWKIPFFQLGGFSQLHRHHENKEIFASPDRRSPLKGCCWWSSPPWPVMDMAWALVAWRGSAGARPWAAQRRWRFRCASSLSTRRMWHLELDHLKWWCTLW